MSPQILHVQSRVNRIVFGLVTTSALAAGLARYSYANAWQLGWWLTLTIIAAAVAALMAFHLLGYGMALKRQLRDLKAIDTQQVHGPKSTFVPAKSITNNPGTRFWVD